MLIASFNCNSVRARLEIILDWLKAYSPDLLALQETKVRDEEFPLAPFEAAGWHVAFRGQKSYNGVAMITREKPSAVSFGLQDKRDGDQDSGPRLAHVRVHGVHVINTYVPQGQALESDAFRFKLEWFGRLKAYLQKRFKNPGRARIVWVGDLNVAPTPVDVYDSKKIWPHVCHCQEVIDAFQDVADLGFVDVFRKHLPDGGTYTFWDYRMRGGLKRNLGWRIDHVLATPPVARKSTEVFVDIEPRKCERPSDHTFVGARFDC